MAHRRTVIRNAIVAALVGQTAAEARVYASRVVPFRRNELPVIAVFALEEDADDEDTAPRELKRDCEVIVEGWVTPGEGVDVRMDDLALEIETALHADPQLRDQAGAPQVGDLVLVHTALELVEAGEREMGVVTLTYGVTYHTLAKEAPADLDDFETVDAKHRPLGAPADANTPEDTFTVEAP